MANPNITDLMAVSIGNALGEGMKKSYLDQIRELSNHIRSLAQYVDDKTITDEIEEVLSQIGYE